jgi:hypothetical protein
MKIFGFYPFTVHVSNMFDPQSDVNFEVKLYQHRSYYCTTLQKNEKDIGGVIITEITSPDGKSNLSMRQIEIPGGHCIGLPMQFGDERVEICLADSSKIDYSYIIGVGARALCRLCKYDDESIILDHYNGVQFTESSFEESAIFEKEIKELEKGYHVGGEWKIPASFDCGWILEIRKHTFDPEEVPVPIGPQVPG